jgi:hypothetical protein
MKSRCTDASLPNWHNYGGRGITYEKRWERFENFFADMGEPQPGGTLDRRNNNGSYSKANCRWVDMGVQRRNSRSPIRWVNINGEQLVLIDAVRRFSPVKYSTVISRIHNGWSETDAILSPLSHRWSRRVARDVNKQQV